MGTLGTLTTGFIVTINRFEYASSGQQFGA
jgi:hypothetical protein